MLPEHEKFESATVSRIWTNARIAHLTSQVRCTTGFRLDHSAGIRDVSASPTAPFVAAYITARFHGTSNRDICSLNSWREPREEALLRTGSSLWSLSVMKMENT